MLNIRDSISGKLTLLTLLASGTALVCASVAFFAYDLSRAQQSFLDRLRTQTQIVGYNCVTPLIFNDPASAEETLSALRAANGILYAGIYKPSGRFFAGYWRDPKHHNNPLPLVSAAQIHNRWLADRRVDLVQPIIFDQKLVGTVYIRSDVNELIDRFKSYLVIIVAILLISLGAAFIVSRVSQRAISGPIVMLANTARRVSRDKDYAARAGPIAGRDEISMLINSFNEMLSEIHRRDVALQESEEQFRTLADSVPQLAWMAHADGSIFWYNERWYKYTGKTSTEMLGWGWTSVHDPAFLPQVLGKWKSAIQAGERFEMVFPLRGWNGEFREFLTLSVPLRDATGNVVRWFGTNTDITEQRRSEDALRKSEKLAATGRLAASIAHEINNPLEALSNLLYLIKKQPAQMGEYLAIAEQELDRITEITKHTLGFYRDASTPVEVSMAEMVKSVLALYARKLRFKRIGVRTRFSEDAKISGHPGELRQVLANLVVNAIEAMDTGGQLSIKVAASREWTGGKRAGVRVTILDTGSGISQEQMKSVFDPFYTTKKDVGTGLGLWLTQTLVHKHDGTIRVRSVAGSVRSGTAFSIFLPRMEINDPKSSRGEGQVEGTPYAANL
jgi:PAS domain S-box-containing protein